MKNSIVSIATIKAIFDSLESEMKNLYDDITSQNPEYDSVNGFYNSDYTCDLLWEMDQYKDLWDSFIPLLNHYSENDCIKYNIDPYWEPLLPCDFDPIFGILL